MKYEFNRYSKRAVKARIAQRFATGTTLFVLKVFVLLMLIGVGALVIVNGRSSVWLFSVPTLLFIFTIWLKNDVATNVASLKTSSVDNLNLNDALPNDVLGRMKDPSTFDGIYESITKSFGASFMVSRFGIAKDILSLPANDAHVASRVWQEAFRLASASGSDKIDGSVILTALLSQVPAHQDFLAAMGLDYQELENGIKWKNHIESVQKSFENKNFMGGIARDWTAGYTPILDKLGHNISADIQHGSAITRRDVESHNQTVDQMINVLSVSESSNVVLIGELGVGKSTTVNALAQKLIADKSLSSSLKYNQVYSIDASTLIANQDVMGGLENLIIALVNEASKAKNIILFFDNADLYFKQEVGSVDLKNLVQQMLDQVPVRIILAMTPTDWQNVTRGNEQLAASANRIVVSAPPQEDVLRIMEDQTILLEYQNNVTYSYQALKESYRLADKYVQEGDFPGKAIKVMESAAKFAQNGYVNANAVQSSIETSHGVKVATATNQEKSELLNLEDTIHQRMINQTRAVKVVSDALRRARSGVNNPNKPIGTFLFMGPTGVGKTELSKAVAASYFGGDDNIIRIDLNEFSAADSGSRIIDANDSSGHGLIAQIRKQPFSVVLFDEIEKADAKVLDLFLQVLDEGIMRDSNNKEVSFRDAIIIATSNAAAEDIQRLIADGHNLEDIEEQFVSSLISSGHFKPEFLNRFDEIVLFRPLNKEELLQVVDLLLINVNSNLERQKISVVLDQAAKQWLVEKGYDERLGARPLRRVVQKTVENIVAKKLLQDSVSPGSELSIGVTDLESESAS